MALKQIKNKIVATLKTGKVTKAMESVSAVKMRKSQERAFDSRPYIRAALRILVRLSATQDGLQHPLTQSTAGTKELLIIVTSDKGLAGSVNNAVLKRVTDYISSRDTTIETVTLGRKATEAMRRMNITVLESFTNLSDDISLNDVTDIVDVVQSAYTSTEYARVVVFYQNFLSTFEQEPTSRQLLPLQQSELMDMIGGIKPKTGKMSDEVVVETNTKIDYKVEPSTTEVLDILIPQLVKIMVYHAILESKASEHSARMVAMKNATDKSKEVAKALTLVYNKERQAAITAEVSEITGGIEAMK